MSKIVEKNNGNPFELQTEKENSQAVQAQAPKTVWVRMKKLLSYIFVDGMSGMAIGLFATLIIGTIIENIGKLFGDTQFAIYIKTTGQFAKFLMGAGIALGMGYKLKKSPLVSISAGVVGMLASFVAKLSVGVSYTSVGEPLGAFIASFVALEVGSLVSGKTKIDIIVAPLTSIFSGALIAFLLGTPISDFMNLLKNLIATAGEQQPFLMGAFVAVLMGVFLTLPISSAAIGVALQLNGIVAGAAVVGCCTQMVGYAVMSFRENKWGGLVAQGVGTSMLQMPNLMKKPILWLPPVIASAILGPVSTCALKMTSTAVGSGMGTAGLVGVIETFASMSATQNGWLVAIQILCVDILAPAVICLLLSEFMRKKGWIKYGDLQLNL